MRKVAPKHQVPLFAALLGAVLLILCESALTESAAKEALKMCATVIIPSLFPYMVISGLIVSLGVAQFIGRLCNRLCKKLFLLPGTGATAIFLGALCGFPIGAQTACSLYENKSLTREETERLICIANNTGPAFVIEVIGAHFWNSRGFGVVLYIAQIISALLIGIIHARTRKKRSDPIPPTALRPFPKRDFLTCFSASVSEAARSVLTVCGFVVFFAVFLALLEFTLKRLGLVGFLPIFAVVAEFTNGTALAAAAGGITGAFLTGFAVGWSGLSVFAQSKMFCSPLGIRLKATAVCKCAQGVLTGIAAAVYYQFFFRKSVMVSTCISVTDMPEYLVAGEIVLLILFCLVPVFFSRKRDGKTM